jgi:cell division protein FtsL
VATAAARAQPRPRHAPARQPEPRADARRETRRRGAARPRLAGSVVWILVVATLLAGIVALNVGVLRSTMEAERLEKQRDALATRHDELAAQLSRAAAAGRIEAIAIGKLGLVHADETTYVPLARTKG